jgi:uncharacterized 2Fe-2S/4Fe-4S cluster protein (DUF4445 family)
LVAHRIVFTPSGRNGMVADGTTVLEAARELGVDLDTVCGGRGICGRCQVEPSLGSFAKWAIDVEADHLSHWGPLEENYRGKRAIVDGRRLGCSAKICGDVVIDVPPESQIHKQVIRKSVDVGDLVVDPIVTLHYLDNVPDGDLVAALKDQWGLSIQESDDGPRTQDHGLHDPNGPRREDQGLRDPNGPRREEQHPLTVAVRAGKTIAATWPGFVDVAVGIAVDIGSTTIAGHLIDLASGEILASAGRMNPQIRFGEDLMSRVSYVMMNPGGDVELTNAVRQALQELSMELLAEAELDADRVLDVTLVGNPVMHHLVLGYDPTPLGQAPFPLATEDAVHVAAVDLDLDLPSASVYVAPCIAGHVGADTAAAILNEGPHRSSQIQLLVDVGTNAEIVLGNDQRMFAASSPTGPAFEGAQISSGQRATAGAIERVRINRDTLEPSIRVIGSDLWSTDPGFAEATADTGVPGICGSGIIEVISEMVICGLIDQQGLIVGEMAARTPRIVADGRTFSYVLHGDIQVTQADVRAIQLAKAALRAGIELLLEHAELDTVDEIRLAGAFGAHIDPAHAMVVGLIPDTPIAAVRAVGNSAGSGAVRLLLSQAQRDEVEAVVGDVTKIETAIEPRFQELFVTALAFPRSTATSSADKGGRRRRRARSAPD